MAAMDCCPTGDGGNSTITNQNEQLILTATVLAVPIETAAMGDEDDSHVSIGYRDAEVTDR